MFFYEYGKDKNMVGSLRLIYANLPSTAIFMVNTGVSFPGTWQNEFIIRELGLQLCRYQCGGMETCGGI